MELITGNRYSGRIKVALFDFDGTISTLRCGWEKVMRSLMLEMLTEPGSEPTESLRQEVDAYIDSSTGIQTVFQMKWLAARIKDMRPASGLPEDAWYYKDEYNRRLMDAIRYKIDGVSSGRYTPDEYLITGAESFLRVLRDSGVTLIAASGTDHDDVVHEAGVLGVGEYFDAIYGAQRSEGCSKEFVLRQLIESEGLSGPEVAVIGDGKVEIALGRQIGARCIGMATNELERRGISARKRERLIAAGADVIAGDFTCGAALLKFLGIDALGR